MMESPLPTVAMCAFYAYFSKSLGPKLMANRKAMDLRLVLVLYNLFQTVFSTWIFYEVCVPPGFVGRIVFVCIYVSH